MEVALKAILLVVIGLLFGCSGSTLDSTLFIQNSTPLLINSIGPGGGTSIVFHAPNGSSYDTVTVDLGSGFQSNNILAGVEIFGLMGTAKLGSYSSCINNGQIDCISNSLFVAGSPQSNLQGPNGFLTITIPQGYYDGTKTVTVRDSNLIPSNIASHATIFGVTGTISTCTVDFEIGCITTSTYPSQTTPSAPALPSDVLVGKQYYVGGALNTGTMVNRGALDASLSFPGPGYYSGTTNNMPTAAQLCLGSSVLGVAGSAVCWLSFFTTGSMGLNPTYPRYGHTATLLTNGNVLIVGGTDNSSGSTALPAMLYSPASGTFSTIVGSDLAVGFRYGHTATLLPNGKVLIAGGQNGVAPIAAPNSAIIYDPVSSTFTSVSSTMLNPRYDHTATLLPSGRVLIAGGIGGSGVLSSAETYDYTQNIFNSDNSLVSARASHTATLMSNGLMMIIGGVNSSNAAIGTIEIYAPNTNGSFGQGNFSLYAYSLNSARYHHTATLLSNWKILITGGLADINTSLASAELIDVSSVVGGPATIAPTNAGTLNYSRTGHSATLLPNGKVFIVGGSSNNSAAISSAELYDPISGTFSLTKDGSNNVISLASARYQHTATLLPSGKVLITGGVSSKNSLALYSAELFQ